MTQFIIGYHQIGSLLLKAYSVTDPRKSNKDCNGDCDINYEEFFYGRDTVTTNNNSFPIIWDSYVAMRGKNRIVRDLPSSKWFKRMECSLRRYYNNASDMKLLSLILCYDSTTLTGGYGGGCSRKITPLYLTLGNAVSKNNGTIPESATMCIGYLPTPIMTEAELEAYISSLRPDLSKSSMDIIRKSIVRYVEQVYIRDILREMHKYTVTGGMLVATGRDNSFDDRTAVTVMPVVSLMVQDNEGGHKCLGVYTGQGCNMPCRICTKPGRLLHQPGVSYSERGTEETRRLIRWAWLSVQHRIFRRPLDRMVAEEAQAAENKCHELSIHAMHIHALHDIFHELNTFEIMSFDNVYMKCPPDSMHTVLAGVLKNWVYWLAVIIDKVSVLDPANYRRNMAVLDERLCRNPSFNIPEILQRFTFHEVEKYIYAQYNPF